MQRVFIHGLDSSSQGTKAVWFAQHFPDMVIPDLEGGLEARFSKLEQILAGASDLVLAGSSYGGLLATVYALRYEKQVKKLLLLAPALNFPEFAPFRGQRLDIPTWLWIGTEDQVTPESEVKPVARKTFTHLKYFPVHDDHLLHKVFREIDWQRLLSKAL